MNSLTPVEIRSSISKSIDFINDIPDCGLQIVGNPITGDSTELVTLEKMKPDDCGLIHRFTPGCYIREILMPKGTVVIGKIHATEHFNIILSGEVTVITSEGKSRFKAPYTFISKAGIQKIVIMHEECRWQTVHATSETDIDKLEDELIIEDYDQLELDDLISKIEGV